MSDEYEQTHVHSVYNQIASHFSATRYKGWPVVEAFLRRQAAGSLGGDIGCGNGKYLNFRSDLFVIGCDRSDELIKIAAQRGFEAFVSDALETGFKSASFDFCISIAVIHHFSTPERRKRAIEELVRIVKSGGSIIIFVWAMEQEKSSKRTFATQDKLVSWKLRTPGVVSEDSCRSQSEEVVLHRYYHLFVKGELDELCANIPGVAVESVGYDRDNHFVILNKL